MGEKAATAGSAAGGGNADGDAGSEVGGEETGEGTALANVAFHCSALLAADNVAGAAAEAGVSQGAPAEDCGGTGPEASGAGAAAEAAEGVQRGCTAEAAGSALPACPLDGLAVSRTAGPLAVLG